MSSNSDRTGARLMRYFASYPARNGGGWAHLARKGEAQRFEVIKSWLPNTAGQSILDVGCGDGVFLSQLLRGRPGSIRLEDLVDRWPSTARAQLNGQADRIEIATGDCHQSQDTSRYDIVFALGVADYDRDWDGLLVCLIRRAVRVLIVDFPKSGTWHSRMRRAWLRFHGIGLHTASRSLIERVIEKVGVPADCVELPLQWVVRFHVDGTSV